MGKVTLRKNQTDGHIGRPTLAENDETVMDGFKIPRSIRDRFSATCEHKGMNKSDVLRDAILKFLGAHEPATDRAYQKALAGKRGTK